MILSVFVGPAYPSNLPFPDLEKNRMFMVKKVLGAKRTLPAGKNSIQDISIFFVFCEFRMNNSTRFIHVKIPPMILS